MKNLIAVVAVIILGIAVGGIIVGFSSTADNIGTQADALGQGLISEDGQWLGAIGSGPEAPGVPQEPDPYEDMDVLDTYILGDAVIGYLYENGDLVVSGSGSMEDYEYDKPSPLATLSNPNTSINKVIIKDGVTTVGDRVFYNCSSLTSVTIPDSVTSIGQYAFWECSSLASVTIPDSVTSIGQYAFWECSSLASVTIPDSVTSLGSSAFSNCSSLASVTIPDSVTSLGSSAFSNCTSLTSITIPDSVTSIGEYAFGFCSSLTSITIPDSVTSLGGWAFAFCTSLTEVKFEGNAPTYGTGIFLATPTDLKVYRKSTATDWESTWGDPSREVVTE
jgi:hypothetical protein